MGQKYPIRSRIRLVFGVGVRLKLNWIKIKKISPKITLSSPKWRISRFLYEKNLTINEPATFRRFLASLYLLWFRWYFTKPLVLSRTLSIIAFSCSTFGTTSSMSTIGCDEQTTIIIISYNFWENKEENKIYILYYWPFSSKK